MGRNGWLLSWCGACAWSLGGCTGHGQHGEPRPDPGALVARSASGTVGVLLDELAPEVRDVVAAEVLARGPEQWEELVQAQLDFAYYRLTFRSYFYVDADPPKGR